MTQLWRGASARSLSSNEYISDESGGVIRVLTYCKIRPRGSTNRRMRCKIVSQQIINRPQRRRMGNIKELYWMKASKDARLRSSSQHGPSCETPKKKNGNRLKRLANSAGEKLKTKSPRQPGKQNGHFKMCYGGELTGARWLALFQFVLMSRNISNASLAAFCVGKRKDSLYGKMWPWSLLEQCAVNWKNQCPSHWFFPLWWGLRP